MQIDNVENLLKPCVLSFVLNDEKKVWITYGQCFIEVLGRNMALIKNKTHSYKELCSNGFRIEVRYIENEDTSPETLRLEYNRVVEEWQLKKYDVISTVKKAVKYTIKLRPYFFNNIWFVGVCLVTRRGYRKIVGLFRTKQEAEAFIDKSYPSKDDITKIKYANNYFTKLFRKSEEIV